jgi:hypothetical protein
MNFSKRIKFYYHQTTYRQNAHQYFPFFFIFFLLVFNNNNLKVSILLFRNYLFLIAFFSTFATLLSNIL